MQCQVKTRWFLALSIITFALELTRADERRSVAGWPMLQSESVQVEEFSSAQGEVISSYIPWFKELGQLVWGWDPAKELKNTTNSIFRDPPSLKLQELMKSLFVHFDVSDTEHFRKLWFRPSAETQFRGLLGIHDFKLKRPLIVLRLGIHGNVDELIAERFLAKIIYENLDANFLIIESLTSHAFLVKNKNISLGGVDEGIQTFLAIKALAKTDFNSLISSVHLVSLSMGSHSTFITAMLDQANGHQIESILNFCPLINLRETFEYHNKPEKNFQNALVDLWNVRRLKAVFDLYPQEPLLSDWWKTIFDFRPRFTSGILQLLNRDRHRPLVSPQTLEKLVPSMKWPDGLKKHFNESTGIFELNNFWKLYQGVKTPMMIYTTPKDPLVINELNSELIFSGNQAGDFSNLKYHRLERGVHCGLAPVYNWNYLTKIVKEGLQL